MNAKELAVWLGKEFLVQEHEGYLVKVRVEDARNAYGRVQCLVKPVEGSGEAWVDSNRLKEKEDLTASINNIKSPIIS